MIWSMLGLLLLMLGCEHPGAVLPRQEGRWSISERRTLELADGSVITDVTEFGVGTMTFNKDGTGSATGDSTLSSFTWDYNNRLKQVVVTTDSYIISYDVLDSNEQFQRWFYWTERMSWTGVITRTEVTLELRKYR